MSKYFATKMPLIVKHYIRPKSDGVKDYNVTLSVEESVLVPVLDKAVHLYPNVKMTFHR